ncbi:MAG: hypothetical protein HY718_05555 [Planctomycetes bacterium]|nr:hypothetical protein [Planctomycetota bacterium]
MQPRTSLRIVRPDDEKAPIDRAGQPDRRTTPFTPPEKREVFKGMVVASLDAGFLRYSRRQELLKTAARLGIPEFEACLLIAEAQFRSGEIDPVEAGDYAADAKEVSSRLTVSRQIILALVVAAFIDLIIVCWLM